jgi:hypothetical protein
MHNHLNEWAPLVKPIVRTFECSFSNIDAISLNSIGFPPGLSFRSIAHYCRLLLGYWNRDNGVGNLRAINL